MTVQKQVLKDSVYFYNRLGYITSTMKTELEDYIDSISNHEYLSVPYSSFDETLSVSWAFNDTARTMTNSTGGSLSLFTSQVSITGTIKHIIIDATDKDVSVQMSLNGTDYFDVNFCDINETVSDTDTLMFKIVSGDNVVRKMIVIYETTY